MGVHDTTMWSQTLMAKILIVDDEVDRCRVMSRLFARRGWSSAVVHDPAAAVATLRADGACAVLLDLSLPGMDGLQVLAAIRADPAVANVPVLVYYAPHHQATAVRAIDAGADDYIPKLTSASQICQRVGLFVPDRPYG
jgi:DNA-binding response OmpR family regulator